MVQNGSGPGGDDAAAGPSGAQTLEGEQAFGEAGFEDGEAFGGGGHGGG